MSYEVWMLYLGMVFVFKGLRKIDGVGFGGISFYFRKERGY